MSTLTSMPTRVPTQEDELRNQIYCQQQLAARSCPPLLNPLSKLLLVVVAVLIMYILWPKIKPIFTKIYNKFTSKSSSTSTTNNSSSYSSGGLPRTDSENAFLRYTAAD